MANVQCIILAGGLATRMRPITETLPKALIPVCGKPFVHHQLEWLARHGVTSAVLSIGYKGDMIRDAVGTGKRWGIEITYVDEGKDLKGTGGALRLCLDEGVLDESFLVTYGDSFLPVDFSAVWSAFQMQKLPALMTVFRNQGKWDTSNVWFKEGRIHLYDKHHRSVEHIEKLQYIDYGLSVFQRSVIEKMVPSGEKVDLSDVFNALSLDGLLAGYEVNTRFYEIGSPEGLADFTDFIEQKPTAEPALSH